MPDNIGYTPGTGASIAADDVGGSLVQRVKAVYGGDGVATDMDEKPSTQALQTTGNTKLDTIVSALASLLAELQQKTEPIDTQPISAAALPLPAGAATSAAQTAGNASLASVDGKLPALSGGKVPVTDPTALPLPSGAATQATLATVASAVKPEDSVSASGDPGVVVLGIRRDADSTAVDNDGDYTGLKLDQFGRLKVSALPAPIASTLLTITANAQSRSIDVSRYSNVMLMCSGTFSTINCTFEGSLDATTDTDGVWFGIQAVRSNANTIELTTGNLSAAPAYAWEVSVNGMKRMRVRSTAYTSGTQNWTFQPGAYATEPIPAAQISGTQPVSGTVTANIGTGSIAAGTNAIGDVGIQYRANATGAGTVTNAACPATPAGQSIKGSAGRLLAFRLVNTNAATRWLKIFNATAVTPGTTSALTEVALPQNQPVVFSLEGGMAMGTGIMIMITAGQGLTNNAAVTLGDVTGFTVHA